MNAFCQFNEPMVLSDYKSGKIEIDNSIKNHISEKMNLRQITNAEINETEGDLNNRVSLSDFLKTKNSTVLNTNETSSFKTQFKNSLNKNRKKEILENNHLTTMFCFEIIEKLNEENSIKNNQTIKRISKMKNPYLFKKFFVIIVFIILVILMEYIFMNQNSIYDKNSLINDFDL